MCNVCESYNTLYMLNTFGDICLIVIIEALCERWLTQFIQDTII